MSVELVQVYTEKLPAARLIGRRYTDKDRLNGSFSHKWEDWFSQSLFAPLEALETLPENGDAYVGAMGTENGAFVYWIGMLFPAGTPAPQGYEAEDLPPQTLAVCWVRGREEGGELYGRESEALCMEALTERGWAYKEDGWCLERYVCPRFTEPDDEGRVILDICLPIREA